MPWQDLGESLVGSYLRYIEGCPIVLCNSFLDEHQVEVDDVVAFKPQPQPGAQREIFVCEVTTHTQGFNTKTTLRLAEKLERLTSLQAPDPHSDEMTDEPLELDQIANQIARLAEQVCDSAGGLVVDDSDMRTVLDAAATIVAAMRDQGRLLSILAKHAENRAPAVIMLGAPDEDQAGSEFCARFAATARAISAAVRDTAATIPGADLNERTAVIDVADCRVTRAEEQNSHQFWRLIEEGGDATTEIDAYDDNAAAEHAARWLAEETPPGRRITVYEVVDGEQLPDVAFSAPGTGGELGLVAPTA